MSCAEWGSRSPPTGAKGNHSHDLENHRRILEAGYEHPHGFVKLDGGGKIWHVVLAPPSRMEFRGLAKESLKPGASVIVEGYQNRGKPEEMRAERVTANGKTVELR